MLQKTVMVPTTLDCNVPVDLYVPETCRFVDPDIRRPAVVVVPGGGYSHLGEREMETIDRVAYAGTHYIGKSTCFNKWNSF